ncbi:42582_t:CDS:2, partial [Gigaspora margarita]
CQKMRRNKTKKARITKVTKKKKRSWNACEKLAIVTYFERSIERSSTAIEYVNLWD